MAMITSLPCSSSGRNGIGGAGMTLAMVESSSGAASAAATKPAMVSAVAGRTSMPPVNGSSGCSRNLKRVTTPKLPPPPRIAQNRSGCVVRVDLEQLAVGGDDLGGEQESMVSPCLRTR